MHQGFLEDSNRSNPLVHSKHTLQSTCENVIELSGYVKENGWESVDSCLECTSWRRIHGIEESTLVYLLTLIIS